MITSRLERYEKAKDTVDKCFNNCICNDGPPSFTTGLKVTSLASVILGLNCIGTPPPFNLLGSHLIYRGISLCCFRECLICSASITNIAKEALEHQRNQAPGVMTINERTPLSAIET